jgi:uncharacterized protein (TIGR03083 family)
MMLSTEECIAAITEHSAGFAAAARGNLRAQVEHCPDWDVADLVQHLTEVHWFWSTIAEERRSSPPDEARRPARASDEELVDVFEAGARRLTDVLRKADQQAACWTWAPHRQDVGFITRHQVQEAAVHHWDAVNAAGGSLAIAPAVAADSVDEFLVFSVADEEDAERERLTPLDAGFSLRASDTGDVWTVTDGRVPGSLASRPAADENAPAISASASDLLLWLYRRIELDTAPVPADVIDRFRALSSTD